MIQNNKKVLGVVLAGGMSKRMKGGNKFFKKMKVSFDEIFGLRYPFDFPMHPVSQ